MDQDPLLERLDVVDNSHARTCLVKVICNIVDDWPPVDQVARRLVGKLLTVFRVSLVRVVSNELALVWPERRMSALVSRILALKLSLQEVRLPDGVGSVGGVWSASLSNVADKLPGPCSVRAGVQVDAGTVVAPAVARTKNGAGRVSRERLSDLG